MTTKLRKLGKDLYKIIRAIIMWERNSNPDRVNSVGHQKELIHPILTKSDLKSDLLIEDEQTGKE